MKKVLENKKINTQQDIVIYKNTRGGKVILRADVRKETIWATQAQIAELFDVNSQAITKHFKNIYREGELVRKATCSKMEQVQIEGRRQVIRSVEVYNLDAIIAVGYRVNSKQATAFRIWATETLRDYIIHGMAVNTERIKKLHDAGISDLSKKIALVTNLIT